MSGRVSVIVDVDNLRANATATRLERVLDALVRQLDDVSADVEVLFPLNDEAVDEHELKRLVTESGLEGHPRVPVGFYEAHGLHYYEAKNAALGHAKGDILVFLDSDTVPEPGWLANLLAPFDHAAVEVAGGQTAIRPASTLYEKAFALFWFFPLRLPDGPPFPAPTFFANSFAIRRDTFERFPFPDEGCRYRGACLELSGRLVESGVTIWRVPTARVEHLPPRASIAANAMWWGHDNCLNLRRLGRSTGPVESLRLLVGKTRTGWRKIRAGRAEVGLPWLLVPAALAIAIFYNLFVWLGFVLTAVSHQGFHRRMKSL